jgi:alkaline phosphatase D
MLAGCFFWPGSEADVQGVRPSYYAKYSDKFPNEKRVEQVLAWLTLPPAQRPHFITLYCSYTDHADHEYGPDSPQVADAVHELDTELGRLLDGVKASKLAVDLIVVADHGMATVPNRWINLDGHGLNLSLLKKYEGAFLYAKSEVDAQKIFDSMQPGTSEFKVYRRAQLPEHLHFDANPRAGDAVIVETGPYAVRITADSETKAKPRCPRLRSCDHAPNEGRVCRGGTGHSCRRDGCAIRERECLSADRAHPRLGHPRFKNGID